jgi:hypothetical protein
LTRDPRSAVRSNRVGRFVEGRGDPQPSWGFDAEFVVTTADVLHEGVPGDDDCGGAVGT